MGFFDGIDKKVTDVGQMAIQKTKETSDIARISSMITHEEIFTTCIIKRVSFFGKWLHSIKRTQ